LIELLDFNLRSGEDAPVAATRAAKATERYLTRTGARDMTAVVTELVAWLGAGEPAPRTLRLELTVTSTVVRVSVTVAHRRRRDGSLASNRGRTRAWAEFDRHATDLPAYTESQYST
jgi:hypothetical protein